MKWDQTDDDYGIIAYDRYNIMVIVRPRWAKSQGIALGISLGRTRLCICVTVQHVCLLQKYLAGVCLCPLQRYVAYVGSQTGKTLRVRAMEVIHELPISSILPAMK
jgi:hypothetical protein